MTNLHSNIKELIEITEAFEGVKNYLTKSKYRMGALPASLAINAAMMKSGAFTQTAGRALDPTSSVANALTYAKAHTNIAGSQHLTNAISRGIQHTVNAGKEASNSMFDTTHVLKSAGDIAKTDTMGISWLPIAAGLTAYGIYRLVKHFKTVKYKEAKIKKLQQILPKVKNPNKAQAIRKHIQDLQIDVNAQRSVMRQQKQESLKQINSASQNQDLKKNPEKLKELNRSKQVLGKIN